MIDFLTLRWVAVTWGGSSVVLVLCIGVTLPMHGVVFYCCGMLVLCGVLVCWSMLVCYGVLV